MEKINSLIQETVSKIINNELAEELQFFVINFVYTLTDLSQTEIYIHFAQGNQEKQLKILNKKKYIIQRLFAKKIQLKNTPKIIFILDKKQEEINKIEQILNKIPKTS